VEFGDIRHVILFGGSRILAELSVQIREEDVYSLDVYTCDRQLNEPIYFDGTKLGAYLEHHKIEFISTDDINEAPTIRNRITENSLGIGLGEAWTFSKDLIDRFHGRLLDFMGIRLPQYRGGAHYTWQILRKNRISCCNLQIINEQMIQGVFDSGEIVKSREYFFPPSARIPEDYFEYAVVQEINFIKEFLNEVKSGKEFQLTKVQENFSIYFPRLNTDRHGFINWNWDTEEIERFICAFDDPYGGASTFINKQRLRLKKCYSEPLDGPFHAFQSGLIYKISNGAVFIATRSGTLIVKQVLDEIGKNVLHDLRPGQRFFTPAQYLEEALLFNAEYSEKGLV
jgi:methionyl-tRNA formyltransferase